MKKILWVKFGWSEFYRGGLVDGNFGWLNDNRGKKDEGRGHEAFNFNPGPDGTYYCYVPPQNRDYAPSHSDPHGWTVICLAKNPQHKGIHVVGWYENATLLGTWHKAPTNTVNTREMRASLAYDWSYCITSKTAYFVPLVDRTVPFSDPSIRQGKYSFLAGPDIRSDENKKRVLALLEGQLKLLAPKAVRNPSEESLPDHEMNPVDPLKGFGTPEHRRKVEKAAENAVISHYEGQGFECTRVTHLPCGYDFIFSKGRKKMHVEVKGTSGTTPQFFLTRNEHNRGFKNNAAWHLAMVTDALTDAPKVQVYSRAEFEKTFELAPYVFVGRLIPK